MNPEQPSHHRHHEQQQHQQQHHQPPLYHLPQAPQPVQQHQHHHGNIPPSSTLYYHHPQQTQAPYEQDQPSWRNGGSCPEGNHLEQTSCHPVKLEDDRDANARYSQFPTMQAYSQQGQQQQQQHHIRFPAAPHYYPPPPVYGNRPNGSYQEPWMSVHPSYMSHYDDKNHPYYPLPPQPPPSLYPYGMNGPYYHHSSSELMLEPPSAEGGGELFHTIDTQKRQHSPPPTSKESIKVLKLSHHSPQNPSSSSPITTSFISHNTKSARRKKKMYSDFVGVTYNKTHAKYQACITHYRKQHYLGRYKLAVDAALAYDESARLLKGTSWKVNFHTRQEYEEAKAKELASVGRNGGEAVDVAGSLAAVALKVEEIASTVAMSSLSGAIRRSLLPMNPRIDDSSHPLYEQRSSGLEGEACDEGAAKKETKNEGKSGTEAPNPLENKSLSLNNTKVTPSPTLPPMSSEQQKGAMSSLSPQLMHELPLSTPAETPLPVTPNPTRHALGTEKSTPDSVIRPKVLNYRSIGAESEDVSVKTPIPLSQSNTEEKEAAKFVDQPEPVSYTKEATTARLFSLEKSVTNGTSNTTAIVDQPKTNMTVSLPTFAPPPPVIQNGTLAAASALMTLFGNERSPQA